MENGETGTIGHKKTVEPPLGALLSSPALDVRLPTALQVLQARAPSAGERPPIPPLGFSFFLSGERPKSRPFRLI